jgi:hypothetical protein
VVLQAGDYAPGMKMKGHPGQFAFKLLDLLRREPAPDLHPVDGHLAGSDQVF